MAAYAAVISLKHTINGLLNSSSSSSSSSSFSSSSSSREILEFAYDEASYLHRVLEGLNGSNRSRSSMERVEALEGQIRDCANKLEDFLEFHEFKQEEEEGVRKEITSFAETAKKTAKDYIEELSRDDDNGYHDDDDDDDDDAALPNDDDDGVEMIGRSQEFNAIREKLLRTMRPVDLCFCSFWGEKGSGRTKVSRTIYEDLSRCRGEYFDCWAWVNVGVGPTQSKQVLMSIISQVEEGFITLDDELLTYISLHELSEYLFRALEHRRYMIVLDDVDDAELVEHLRVTSFPDQGNGSLVLFTTTLNDVALLADLCYPCKLPPRFFQESMWPPLRAFFFEFESNTITPEMEEAGKRIIENCCCSLIAAAKTLLCLSETDIMPEQWRKIAADKENHMFAIGDELSEINKIKAEMRSWDKNDKSREVIAELISLWLGFSSDIENVKSMMHPKRLFSKMQIISILGMVGIGKTTFIRKVFKDESVRRHFDYQVWITLGPKYKTKDILIDILVQMYPNIDRLHMKRDETLIMDLCVQVSNKRCLIVLDDLCSTEPLFHLNNLFPEINGTTLVTTRLAKVAKLGTRDDNYSKMELLGKEESWSLLCHKLFAGEPCPPELEKAGHMIAEKCDGLPLLILTVADQLLRVEMSQEKWDNIAFGKERSVFKNAHRQISRGLLPSYQGLPHHLKACFLYLAIFREKYEIPASNLANLWISEGFLEPNSQTIMEDFVVECLSELDDISLLIVKGKVFGSQIKTCRLHSIFWHLSNSEALKNKFFHAMNSYDDCSIETMGSHRRLCIRNSVLLGMKDVQSSMASNATAHSLLCVGPLHQFPVPLNLNMRLLRVMNTITIRLYEFPHEVVKLVHLRYLGLTCNGNLPTSISSLYKLRYLIVKRYLNMKSLKNSPLLPAEIWDMKELEHLEVMGGRLPDRKSGPGLLKLTTLLNVNAESCRPLVLIWIPNLKRLSIHIDLAPGDTSNYSFRCLNNISRLHKLESLKCAVVNPQFTGEDALPPSPISMFPASLKRLSLSGLGYPWEYMSIIGKLENLEVLKLKCYAFRGSKWEIDRTTPFPKLKFLLLQSTDLVEWKANSVTNMVLDHLSIKHCYRLQELPIAAPIGPLIRIEIVDSNPLVVTWAEHFVQELRFSEPQISLSWID